MIYFIFLIFVYINKVILEIYIYLIITIKFASQYKIINLSLIPSLKNIIISTNIFLK